MLEEERRRGTGYLEDGQHRNDILNRVRHVRADDGPGLRVGRSVVLLCWDRQRAAAKPATPRTFTPCACSSRASSELSSLSSRKLSWRWMSTTADAAGVCAACRSKSSCTHGPEVHRASTSPYMTEVGPDLGFGRALSLCTAVHPLYTRFTEKLGTSISETTIRPSPTRTPLRSVGPGGPLRPPPGGRAGAVPATPSSSRPSCWPVPVLSCGLQSGSRLHWTSPY